MSHYRSGKADAKHFIKVYFVFAKTTRGRKRNFLACTHDWPIEKNPGSPFSPPFISHTEWEGGRKGKMSFCSHSSPSVKSLCLAFVLGKRWDDEDQPTQRGCKKCEEKEKFNTYCLSPPGKLRDVIGWWKGARFDPRWACNRWGTRAGTPSFMSLARSLVVRSQSKKSCVDWFLWQTRFAKFGEIKKRFFIFRTFGRTCGKSVDSQRVTTKRLFFSHPKLFFYLRVWGTFVSRDS